MQIRLTSSENSQKFQGWLGKRRGVEKLSAKGSFYNEWRTWRPLQLPVLNLTMLRSLELSTLRVRPPVQGAPKRSSTTGRGRALTGASSSGAAATILPQLRELALYDCELTSQLLSQLLSSIKVAAGRGC